MSVARWSLGKRRLRWSLLWHWAMAGQFLILGDYNAHRIFIIYYLPNPLPFLISNYCFHLEFSTTS